jgi:hypothetical protein
LHAAPHSTGENCPTTRTSHKRVCGGALADKLRLEAAGPQLTHTHA